MSSLLRPIVRLLGILLPASLCAQEPAHEHLLRMAFRTGAVQCYRKNMTVEVKKDDAPFMTSTLELTLATTVTAVRDGKAELQQDVRRIVASGTGPGARNYDSDIGGSDLQGMGPMVGKSFTMKSDDRGSISDFKRPDDVPNNSASDPFVVRGIAFAEKPVRVGASWEVSSTMILPEYGPTDVVLVHRLEGVDKGKATIETQVRIDKDKVLLPDGMTITKNCGTCVLELATGKLLEARAELAWASTRGAGNKMEMSMTTTVQAIEPPPAKPAAGTEAPPTRGKG